VKQIEVLETRSHAFLLKLELDRNAVKLIEMLKT
jgi:hypothetical protein